MDGLSPSTCGPLSQIKERKKKNSFVAYKEASCFHLQRLGLIWVFSLFGHCHNGPIALLGSFLKTQKFFFFKFEVHLKWKIFSPKGDNIVPALVFGKGMGPTMG